LPTEADARSRTISGATAYIIGAARTIANDAVQLHGGIGVTEELEISHHFRRLMVVAALLEGRDAQLKRFGQSLEPVASGTNQ
jgi:alkylation response protein AidB-like acyl-CoA dehydrogenase